MIRVEKVTKYYPTTSGLHYVLRNASVEIPARAQIGVLGRNGSGKSTLMRMLSGVDVPNQGRIVKWGSVSWPLGIASGVQSQMTGRENTRFACRIQGLQFDEMDPIIEFVQSFADIGRYFDMPARSYSSGMKARLGFGITMAFDFDFYIIDELSAVGDSVFKAKAMEIFRQKRLKAGFVRASHNIRNSVPSAVPGLSSTMPSWSTGPASRTRSRGIRASPASGRPQARQGGRHKRPSLARSRRGPGARGRACGGRARERRACGCGAACSGPPGASRRAAGGPRRPDTPGWHVSRG
jgi:capsular polysaccharide transport system ATP-binding protein